MSVQGLDCLGITDAEFTPNNVQTSRRTNAGGSQVLTTGLGFWTAKLRIETPTRQAFSVWDAWATARQASRYPFLLGRTFRNTPRGGAVTDSGLTLTSINAAAGTITLGGAGTYTARMGDMISYKTSAGGYWLGTALANVVAAGGSLTIPVWPMPLPANATPKPRRTSAFGEFTISRVRKSETFEPNYFEFEAEQVNRTAADEASTLSAPNQGQSLAYAETLTL
jgi:hypothetical protein